MKWSDIPLRPTARALRQFSAAWLVVFLAIGARQYLAYGHHLWGSILMALAVTIGLSGLIWPTAVHWIFVGWMAVAFPIGWLVSQLLLVVLFYGVITPVAVLFRLRGRDILCRNQATEGSTYWIPKRTPQDVRSYFRQF